MRTDVDEEAAHDEPGYYRFTYRQPYYVPRSRGGFSRVEIKHLFVASCLLILISLSFVMSFIPLTIPTPFDFVGFLVLTAILFMCFLPHEFMHKALAQKYGLFAEFRIIPSYALLTLITTIFPVFRIFAPGAVFIAGQTSPERYGKTAAAGPATNVVIGAALLGLFLLFPSLSIYLVIGIFLCGWIALFNLFPVPPLDGEKIIHWSRTVFFVLFVCAFALFAYGTYMLYTVYA
jgi:Zn-dependent protease